MNSIEEYKEFEKQCRLCNVCTKDVINFRIMNAIERIAKNMATEPSKELTDAKAEIAYLSQKAAIYEAQVIDTRNEGIRTGIAIAKGND